MATFSQRDIQLLFIGAAATKTTGAISAMNDGEIGIFTPAGTRVTEATAATISKFIIVKKTANGGVPLVSGIIDKNNIKYATRKVYTAATDEVYNIGYNGSTGSIEAINDNDYTVRISLRQGRTSNHGGLYVKHAFYHSDLSATEFEVASNITKAIQDDFSKEPERILKAEMLCDDAGTATTGTVTFVTGTKVIVTTVPGDFEVGGLVRLGTATTSPVYKISAISGNNLTVTTKVEQASATLGIGAAESVAAADAITASYGVKLTGVTQAYKVGKLDQDLQPNIFDVNLENFGTTTSVLTTAATAGNGTEKQVKALEFFCQGNEGDFYRMGEPLTFDRRTEASGNYDLIDIVTEEIYADSIVAGPIRKVYTLAIPETAPNYAVTGTADDITDVLEVLAFGSANGNLAVS